MRAVSLGLTIAVCGAVGLHAQSYAYQSFTANAGISVANAIAFDRNDALVAGTNDGVFRFDGLRFDLIPLPGASQPRIVRITTSPDSSLWIQTEAGGLFHLARDDRITRVDVPSTLAAELAAYRYWQRLRVDGAGHVWINGSGRGLWRFDPTASRWSHVDVSGGTRLVDFFFDGHGVLWLASERMVGRVTLQGEDEVAPKWVPVGKHIVFIRAHSPGHAWLGTEAGIYVLADDGEMRRTLGAEYAASRHAEPDVDASGRLLASVGAGIAGQGRSQGVVRLGAAGDVEFPRSRDPVLGDLLPRQLLFGREGDFWLAHEGGLIHVDREYLVSFPVKSPNGASEFVKGLVADVPKKTLWISTWGGMYRLRDGRVERVSSLPRRATTHATLARDASVWWMEHNQLGFSMRNGARRSSADDFEHLVYETRTGAKYLARFDGLHRRATGTDVQITARRFIAAPAAEDGGGRVWISPAYHGIDTVEGDSLASECRACVSPSMRAVISSLRTLPVIDIRVDAFERLWIAAGREGLICVFKTADGGWNFRRLRVEDGLLSEEVQAIFTTPDGRLWVGTPRGLQEFRLRRDSPRLDGLLEFRARDGISREFVSAILEDRDGFLWFGAAPGELHRLDYRHMPHAISPRLRIARLDVDGVQQRYGSEPVRLASGGTHLSIHLAAETYRDVERLRVEYRLVSRDTSWTGLGSGRTIQIASMAPGRYRFEARAVRPGESAGPVVQQDFIAVPPFFRTWWFTLVAITVLALPPGVWYRNRVERRLALERLRLRIATDLHDDLGSGLTQVSLYSELIRRASEPQVAAWAEQVGDQARSLSEGMRDIIWAIHPQHETWESVESRIKDYAVSLLAPRGIVLDMHGTLNGASPTLSTDVRHNVLLLVKEALHNAARHGGSKSITIRWRLTTGQLLVTIRDDGAGFDPSLASTGNGLKNLRRRAASMHASLRLETALGRGTCVEVDVPLRAPRANYPSM